MMTLEEALSKLDIFHCQDIENVDLLSSNGRVLAEDIYSKIDVPSFNRSAMDGYAVRSDELKVGVKLKVIGKLLAGDYKEFDNVKNSAVRVMTGAYVPDYYDAVIKQEDTDYGEDEVLINAIVKKGTNIALVGEDIKKDSLVIPKNTLITPVYVSTFAQLGYEKVRVYRRLNASLISTGSELVDVGEKLSDGKIYNSSMYMFMAYLESYGIKLSDRCICKDETELIKEKISDACKKSDIVILTGGVSVGEKDLVPMVLENMGAKELFRGIDIQPGTPTSGYELDGKFILALSGNPYAAFVHFNLFVPKFMEAMYSCKEVGIVRKKAVFVGSFSKSVKRRRLVRAYYDGGKVYLLQDGVHASSVISNLSKCNCMIDMTSVPNENDEVWVIILTR